MMTSGKFDLSPENSPILPNSYPQEIFMLQCYFLARFGGIGELLLTGQERKRRVGVRTPRGSNRLKRNMISDWDGRVRGAGPESGGGSSEAKQQGSETRVACGVTGNRSVGGRWQHRKQAGPSPLGGSSGRRQSCEGSLPSTWRLFHFILKGFSASTCHAALRNARTAASKARG